jgi:conjugal transfer pilus assembly protein TraF
MKRLILATFLLSHICYANWHEKKAEGWAWYEDEKRNERKEEEPKKVVTPKQRLDEVKQNIEEKLAQAILEPTTENVKSYMEEQKKWVDQSSVFANVWVEQLLNSPQLDNTVQSPVSQYGIQALKQEEFKAKSSALKELSKEYGLFFFFKGEDVLSQYLSYVVSAFEESYSWSVIPISIDDTPVPKYQDYKTNLSVIEKLEVDVFPALYAVKPNEEKIIPIAFGAISLDQLEDRIYKILFLNQSVRGKGSE